ncbi:aminotransferase class V-fold PLP-dependent enzyme [Kribbella antibiotica]|uniref:Aminotransferase class V-fold PLP-dependent enzyme n=1 Tax=Kribbella antibiotica TaxID=190195 RepID=A0A4R4ZU40_9ACTN|nr:aminotransferase class V-fold PLP-dependent enzyme [Kribbella antibiotica]
MVTVLSPRPDLWTLDPDVVHLNHGSWGAVPRRTQEVLASLRAEAEANPMVWFRSVPERLTAARLELAAFLEADPAGFALVPNASAGITAAFATVPISSHIVTTSHVYGASRFAAERVARASGAELRVVDLPMQADDATIVALIEPQLTGACALLVDHVSAATGTILPIARLVELAHTYDVPVIVDGAHAPALIDAPTGDGADFWTGNFHKWPSAPRATAGLVVAEKWRTAAYPLITSWSEYDERLPERFDMQGTQDYAAWIAAPESLRVLADLEWSVRRPQITAMLEEGARLVAKALGTSVGEVANPAPTLRLVELPIFVADAEPFKQHLSRELQIEITLTGFEGRSFIRLSAHAYNTPECYQKLSEGLPRVLA